MIEGLKPYEVYRESGLRWLGRIPSHWTIARAKSLIQAIDERSKSGSEELLTVSSARGVVPRRTATVTMFKAQSYAGYKLCWPGDLVINSLWAWAGGLGVSQHHGIISSAYGVYRVRPGAALQPSFLHEMVRSSPFNWELQVRSKGIWISRLQLTDDSFLNAPVFIPPTDEQSAIVRFLDHANRRIDSYIRAKRKLIALLNEQKQAIIHRAVTRGLDPNVPMKDSGVEWIGQVPAHWDLVRLGRCLSLIEQGWSPVPAEGALEDGQWAVLALSAVRRGTFVGSALKPISRSMEVPNRLAVREGDFLLTRSNSRERVGDVCIAQRVRPKTILSDLIYRLSIKTNAIDSRFLMNVLLSPVGRTQIEQDARGSSGSMPKLSQGHIKSWRIPLPSIQEQTKINATIDQQTQPIVALLSIAEREIDRMREYRTRLVADVVTGQLDVREAARHLPDEVAESAPVDDEGEDVVDDRETAAEAA